MMPSMFEFHTAFALETLAAIAATFLIVATNERIPQLKKLGTWVGGLGLLISATSLICTTYYGVTYWRTGIYSPQSVTSMQQMMGTMMPMHEKMMNGMMGSGSNGDSTEKDPHHPDQK